MTVVVSQQGLDQRIAKGPAKAIRAAIALAGGNEMCFACQVDEAGVVVGARPVARGDVKSVLALPGFAQRGEMLVHNHPSGVLEPSGADTEIAARIHADGIGFGITDNAASRLYVVVEVPTARRRVSLDPVETGALLGPGGPIAAHRDGLGQYEDRQSQREMAERIARLYSLGGIGLIEAGTGVGKTLGYLVPALRWAAANGERTIVSTNTISLQEQLVGKDLPFLVTALADQPVRFALLKGWRNYVCLQRLDQACASSETLLDAGAADELYAVASWAARTRDGSLADLPIAPRPAVWDEVAAEADLCTRLRCGHFDKCFVFAARREAAQADVVVVNHHLLMADIAVRRASQNWDEAAVLPAYTRLVVDEAHHFEDAASAHLGQNVSRRGLQRLFARLERRGKGLLPLLDRQLAAAGDLLSVASLDLVRERLSPSVAAARQMGDRVFDLLDGWLATAADTQVRLTEAFNDDQIWRSGLSVALDDELREIDLIADGLRMVRERLETDVHREAEMAPLLNEIRGVSRRLLNAADALRGALQSGAEGAERVRWIEVRKGAEERGTADAPTGIAGTSMPDEPDARNIVVASVRLNLAPILRENLFRRLETCVLTSATLATGEGFGFIAARLGLDQDDVEPVTASLPSPFDYARHALFAIPTDFPAPNEDAALHLRRTVQASADLIEAADGGVFLLFTSHRDVREAAQALRALGVNARRPILVHGEEPRSALLRRFRDLGNAVLVGTSSFWEGVDVPGRALRGLLMARIPFRVPSEPVAAAQCEAIEAAGRDAFAEFMVPHAALRLKQGFGRLIRTATDRGAVVLCDPRAVRKSYGRALLAALPPARRMEAPWFEVREELTRFYRKSGETIR
ncbi:MAG TPA: helicase C-terminal domain-containing protein [Gemmatimonadaceae bacterium]|nr:helicase C-terminal domain-containing protein [Gemmatimonadaceae bacterium]